MNGCDCLVGAFCKENNGVVAEKQEVAEELRARVRTSRPLDPPRNHLQIHVAPDQALVFRGILKNKNKKRKLKRHVKLRTLGARMFQRQRGGLQTTQSLLRVFQVEVCSAVPQEQVNN